MLALRIFATHRRLRRLEVNRGLPALIKDNAMHFSKALLPYGVILVVLAIAIQYKTSSAALSPVSDSEAALQLGGACCTGSGGIACTNWCVGNCTGTPPNCTTTGRYVACQYCGKYTNGKALYTSDYIPCGAWCCRCGAYCGFVFAPRTCSIKLHCH
jgi:hypothetical protein